MQWGPAALGHEAIEVAGCQGLRSGTAELLQCSKRCHVTLLGRHRGCIHIAEASSWHIVVVDDPLFRHLRRVRTVFEQHLDRDIASLVGGGMQRAHARIRFEVWGATGLDQEADVLTPVEQGCVVQWRVVCIVEDVAMTRAELRQWDFPHVLEHLQHTFHDLNPVLLDRQFHSNAMVCFDELLHGVSRNSIEGQSAKCQHDPGAPTRHCHRTPRVWGHVPARGG
mmetsp:Transcript_87087/g.219269  ORF Transcript_87087/g.219269 Transcript_87087/m.219269 type:complete len:224 (+) Transcript_87087:309-980(+)